VLQVCLISVQESITPGARIEAERRLHALEREAFERMQSNKERQFSVRYHKVKFFGTYGHASELMQNVKNSCAESGNSNVMVNPTSVRVLSFLSHACF